MTAAQFRAFVDRYSAETSALARIRDVAETFGWTWKRVHSYYYGERKVPDHIAAVVKPEVKTARAAEVLQSNATLLMVRAELDRLERYAAAVEKMCGECEPSGECRTPTCPLRAVTRTPLAPGVAA